MWLTNIFKKRQKQLDSNESNTEPLEKKVLNEEELDKLFYEFDKLHQDFKIIYDNTKEIFYNSRKMTKEEFKKYVLQNTEPFSEAEYKEIISNVSETFKHNQETYKFENFIKDNGDDNLDHLSIDDLRFKSNN